MKTPAFYRLCIGAAYVSNIISTLFYHVHGVIKFLSHCLQILDPEMFEHLQQNGDLTHFYFCYRWFLLDFKRGLWPHTLT